MAEEIIANAQTKSHILGSKPTKDNQWEPAVRVFQYVFPRDLCELDYSVNCFALPIISKSRNLCVSEKFKKKELAHVLRFMIII